MFNIIILGLTSLLTDISSEMVYPLLPIYLKTVLGTSPAIIGFIEGIAESIASLLKVFSGYISDLFKRRKVYTIIGYASSTVGKLFLYLSTTWGWVLAGRIIDRFGKGVRTAPRDALIADLADSKKRGSSYGLHRAMDTIGAATGVIIAYWLFTSYKGNFKSIFLFSLIPAFLGVLLLFKVREKRKIQTIEKKKLSLNWKKLNRKLKLFLFVTFLFTLGNSSNQFLLLRAQNVGINTANMILLYLLYNLVYAVSSYPAGKLSDKIGRKSILITGYIFYSLVYFGFAVISDSVFNLILLFSAYGIYSGLTEGVEKSFVADVAPENLKATMIGLHATLVGIGLFPASVIAGISWNLFGPSAPFYVGGIFGLMATIGLSLL